MKKIFLLCAFALAACTSQNDSTLQFECKDQNQGEACYKLGKKTDGVAAVPFYQRGCELMSTKACLELQKAGTPEQQEFAKRSLSENCKKGITEACGPTDAAPGPR